MENSRGLVGEAEDALTPLLRWGVQALRVAGDGLGLGLQPPFISMCVSHVDL